MLIALKADSKVYLAYNLKDLSVNDFDSRDFLLEDNIPLWKVKNGCIMGFDGDYDEADILRYDERIFTGEINLYNLFERILPKMTEKLSAFKKLNSKGSMQGDYVIAQGRRGYYIYGAGEAEELEDYFCLGNGYQKAQAALDMTEGQSVTDRIKFAYETDEAAENIPAYPIAIIDTKSCKINIIDKD